MSLMREGIVPAVPAPVPAPEGAQPLPVSLTDDELQLLAEIATGVTTDVAARRLELSARTLRRRLRAICDQLGVNTPIEAVVWAARKQLI
ncbi:DNA-binding NarL/FixJ family response regulator [Streptomonospora nanhaiensis]|uniref:DNA-binding NarL/FixJ family response regulator n=2 Tax=Streptomonospora nanhaiensis TaxID=1323731 RepID=A0A853BLI0_9ACTN|nr:DNA-binding NarL/FixJ family response regulator [Streptomonospora nanhaiensis]